MWTATTNFESTRVHAAVLVATIACSFAVTWELSELWGQEFGYSSLANVVVFFAVYAVFGYVSTLATDRET
jgi:hypothetical protein